jgi:hypothetical protein
MPAKMVRAKAGENFVRKARQNDLNKSPPKLRTKARQNCVQKARQYVVDPISVIPNVTR